MKLFILMILLGLYSFTTLGGTSSEDKCEARYGKHKLGSKLDKYFERTYKHMDYEKTRAQVPREESNLYLTLRFHKDCLKSQAYMEKARKVEADWAKHRAEQLKEHASFRKRHPKVVRVLKDLPQKITSGYKLNQIRKGYAGFNLGRVSKVTPIIAIKKDSFSFTRKGQSLGSSIKCMELVKETHWEGLDGFKMPVQIFKNIKCPK